MVLMSPDLGEPRIDQATPATSGGTNNGSRLAPPMKRLPRRVGAHDDPRKGETDRHRQQRAARAGDQRVGECEVDVRIGEDRQEILERQIEYAKPIHHRIGVGERAEQQHRHRIEHEKREHDEQSRPTTASRQRREIAPNVRSFRWTRLMPRSLSSPSSPLANLASYCWRTLVVVDRMPITESRTLVLVSWVPMGGLLTHAARARAAHPASPVRFQYRKQVHGLMARRLFFLSPRSGERVGVRAFRHAQTRGDSPHPDRAPQRER